MPPREENRIDCLVKYSINIPQAEFTRITECCRLSIQLAVENVRLCYFLNQLTLITSMRG